MGVTASWVQSFYLDDEKVEVGGGTTLRMDLVPPN